MSIASSPGLTADDAFALQDSDKLTLRLLTCDVLARAAPVVQQAAQFETDLAHAQEEVAERCPDVDREPLRRCRVLVPAMVTARRRDRGDQFPDGRRTGAEWLARLRAALDRDAPDTRG